MLSYGKVVSYDDDCYYSYGVIMIVLVSILLKTVVVPYHLELRFIFLL